MMMLGQPRMAMITENNPLGLSWHDTNWIPMLNTTTVMDYFSERSNPFYDRSCNNEIVKMQRLSPEHLQNMTGLEYILLHVQEPILYVIRKQHRHTPTQCTPLADYYIIAGIVYQAPDLASVLNSRLLSTVHHLQSAFDEASSYARYHPSKGYTWDFKPAKSGPGADRAVASIPPKKETEKVKEEPSSLFQRQRVDMLLAELTRKFPIPIPAMYTNPTPAQNGATVKTEPAAQEKLDTVVTVKQEPVDNTPDTINGVSTSESSVNNSNGIGGPDIKPDIKNEGMKPPPEKKPRLA